EERRHLPQGAAADATATGGNAAPRTLAFNFPSGLARGDVGLHLLHLADRQVADSPAANQRLHMRLNAATIGENCRGFNPPAASSKNATGLRLFQVPIADFGNSDARLAGAVPIADWVAAVCCRPEELARELTCLVDGDAAIAADHRLPKRSGSTAAGSITGDKRLSLARLDANSKAGQFAVPNYVAPLLRSCGIERPLRQLLDPAFPAGSRHSL